MSRAGDAYERFLNDRVEMYNRLAELSRPKQSKPKERFPWLMRLIRRVIRMKSKQKVAQR